MNSGIWTKFEGNPILGGERLGTRFSCERIIKERGGTVLPPAATVLYMR